VIDNPPDRERSLVEKPIHAPYCEAAEAVPLAIQYGGSVKPNNIAEIMAQAEIKVPQGEVEWTRN